MERAVFGNRHGETIVGYGPFTRFAQPPSTGVAFYRNDFSLSVQEPWYVPSRIEVLGRVQPLKQSPIQWTAPDPSDFARVFKEITDAIGHGLIEKSVPVVTMKGVGNFLPDAFFSQIPHLPSAMRPYGWIGENEGFLGATPEVLFRYFDGRVYTMALAGTARNEERALFALDEKEIREHEFVAQNLIGKLSDLGMVIRKARGILDLGQLIHFQTLINVELYKNEGIETLIKRLHPTPALGSLPRTDETLNLLEKWRNQLGCPSDFGAPFGFLSDGEFEALVAIRMISWKGKDCYLPSGCGIIEQSRLVNEWRELALKRGSVLRIFGMNESC